MENQPVVTFYAMADATRADYALLEQYENDYLASYPERLLDAVRALESTLAGYHVTRYEHSLQSATRAYRDGRSEAYVVACLLHDIGDVLAPYTHSEMVAAILRPFLPERLVWMVKHHGLFQSVYNPLLSAEERNARDRYQDHPWYEDCVEFCAKYDQNCFDPTYESLPLDFFAPMVQRVFSGEPKFSE